MLIVSVRFVSGEGTVWLNGIGLEIELGLGLGLRLYRNVELESQFS